MKNYKRTILITGATDGIGKQIALELSSNYNENFVIIHGRCQKKCEATLDFLQNENRVRPTSRQHSENVATFSTCSSNIDYVVADFTHLSEICRMSDEIKKRFPMLNTMIACVSILVPRKMTSRDGNELTLQLNHLSHYILWNALLPVLEANAPSRILTIGSMLHSFNSIDWNDINCVKGIYDKFSQYSKTKLMNHLATFYIHRLLFKHGKQFQVTANVVDADQQTDPRLSRTFANHFSPLSASESHLNSHVNGVQTLIRLVESSEFLGVSGKYFDANGKEIRKNAEVGDVRLQNRLWETSWNVCSKFGIKFEKNQIDIDPKSILLYNNTKNEFGTRNNNNNKIKNVNLKNNVQFTH